MHLLQIEVKRKQTNKKERLFLLENWRKHTEDCYIIDRLIQFKRVENKEKL